jgi:hypothetical protein
MQEFQLIKGGFQSQGKELIMPHPPFPVQIQPADFRFDQYFAPSSTCVTPGALALRVALCL